MQRNKIENKIRNGKKCNNSVIASQRDGIPTVGSSDLISVYRYNRLFLLTQQH